VASQPALDEVTASSSKSAGSLPFTGCSRP